VITFKIQDDNYFRSHIKWRSTVRAGSVVMEESKLAQSEIGKLTVAISANQHIFQFLVPKNQRNIHTICTRVGTLIVATIYLQLIQNR